MKNLELSHAQQMREMQNRLIAMEKAQTQHHKFPPKFNNDKWNIDKWQKKSNTNQEPRPPTQPEPNNMASHDDPPFCRVCEEFHEESTCVVFRHFNEDVQYEGNHYVGISKNINVVGKPFQISKDQMRRVKEGSLPADKVTQILGNKPSKEQILQMMNFKGISYQRRPKKDVLRKTSNQVTICPSLRKVVVKW